MRGGIEQLEPRSKPTYRLLQAASIEPRISIQAPSARCFRLLSTLADGRTTAACTTVADKTRNCMRAHKVQYKTAVQVSQPADFTDLHTREKRRKKLQVSTAHMATKLKVHASSAGMVVCMAEGRGARHPEIDISRTVHRVHRPVDSTGRPPAPSETPSPSAQTTHRALPRPTQQSRIRTLAARVGRACG
eukprot:scaffold160560_cov31-Tisochrysis_lutea.AAC.4